MEGRALWNAPNPTVASTPIECTPYTLPAGGVITLDSLSVVTLAADTVLQPQCTNLIDVTLADVSSNTDMRDPFFASTLPVCYAIAATTVIAYMLVIMLFITPRSFISGGVVVLGRRGFTNGPSRGDVGVGIGGRPWLQKVAALTVAISLTIATANTFRIVEQQYTDGKMDARALQDEVFQSMELKVIRIVSDTFLWLAQAQTLIRLFPRQREKVVIKWTAFALITLNLLFSILNTFAFASPNSIKPYSISEAIPAVSYLFHLALGLLYCAWVLYYGLTKRAYAFYHPRARNICLLALIAVISVIVPVVFFVVDISKPNVAAWGDYVRWVGAAAASVVVWEWVERIEALEREDKKDGVLGREVFDGDEMLEITPSTDSNLTGRRPRNGRGDDGGGSSSTTVGSAWPAVIGLSYRYRPRALQHSKRSETMASGTLSSGMSSLHTSQPIPRWPSRPAPAATPVSRTDSASADSTVYAIRYHPISESREPNGESQAPQQSLRNINFDIEAQQGQHAHEIIQSPKENPSGGVDNAEVGSGGQAINIWQSIHRSNPFRKREPPPEVLFHTKMASKLSRSESPWTRWDIFGKLEAFVAVQAEKLMEKARPTHDPAALPVTRIPAPPRRRTLREIIEEIDGAVEPQQSTTAAAPVADTTTVVAAEPSGISESSPPTQDTQAPGDIEVASIRHRGSVSFATTVQRDWDRRIGDACEATESHELHSTGQSGQSSQYVSGSASQSRALESSRLPVVRIPAPPRQTRSGD